MVFVGVMLCNSLDMNQKKKGGGHHIPKHHSRCIRRYQNLKFQSTVLPTSVKSGKFLDQLSEDWAIKEQYVRAL